MGKLNLTVNNDIERIFRKAAFDFKGMKKGSLAAAFEEAVLVWIESLRRNKKGMEENEPGLTHKELEALRDIDSGRAEMITYPNAEAFLNEMRKD